MAFLIVDKEWVIIDADDAACLFYGFAKDDLIGLSFRKLKPESGAQTWFLPTDLTPGNGGRIFLEQLLASGNRSMVTIDWGALELQGQHLRQLYIHTDGPQRCTANSSRLCEARTGTLLGLYQMSEESEEKVFSYVLESCLQFSNSKFGFVAMVDPDTEKIIRPFWSRKSLTYCAMPEAMCHNLYIADGGHIGTVLKDKKPVMVNDYWKKSHLPKTHLPLKRFMLIPILQGTRVFLIAGFANRDSDYTANDVHQLTLVLSGMMNHVIRLQKNNELKAEKKRAEEESKAKSRFLANMSHEIRTPMNGIMGMTELAMQLDIPAELQRYLSVIKNSSLSLLGIINDILDISRIESGKFSLSKKAFSLRNVISSVADTLRPLARKKKLNFSIFIDDDIDDCFFGDALRLQQVLFNLIGNALKFTDNGFCELWVRNLENEKTLPDNHCGLKFIVKDSGIGIPEDKISSIFDLFTQVDGSITRRFGGSGLGLSICRNLVKMMGGEIEAQSKPGIGSTFSFYVFMEKCLFPCVTDTEQLINSGIDVKIPALRILVAEDNVLNQQVISAYLEKQGHSFKIAVNGKEALLKLAEEQFDFVLMDVEMPIMDGIEAIKLIRSNKEKLWKADIPIILLTAHALKGDRERFLDSGANDYLPKPLNFLELKKAIVNIMTERGLFIQKNDKSYVKTLRAETPLLDFNKDEDEQGKEPCWLNKKAALAAIENDEELLNDIFQIFLREAAENLQNLKNINFTKNGREKCNEARILIHSIKGSAFSIGAIYLGNQAAKIETFFKTEDVKSALSEMTSFEQIFLKTVELIKNECIL